MHTDGTAYRAPHAGQLDLLPTRIVIALKSECASHVSLVAYSSWKHRGDKTASFYVPLRGSRRFIRTGPPVRRSHSIPRGGQGQLFARFVRGIRQAIFVAMHPIYESGLVLQAGDQSGPNHKPNLTGS